MCVDPSLNEQLLSLLYTYTLLSNNDKIKCDPALLVGDLRENAPAPPPAAADRNPRPECMRVSRRLPSNVHVTYMGPPTTHHQSDRFCWQMQYRKKIFFI